MNDVISHKCPNCDGPLLFDPEKQSFHCEYCLSIFTELNLSSNDETTKISKPSEETFNLYLCPNCGAEVITESMTAATFCYYCHNPIVLKDRISGKFLPNAILPFKISQEKAKKEFIKWTNTKKFIPNDYFNEEQIEKISGIYFPYWCVDTNLVGSLKAETIKSVTTQLGGMEYTRTRHYSLEREAKITFKSLLKIAHSKNVKQNMIESVKPFPIEECRAFDSAFLSGFQAEKRDLEFQDINESIQDELESYTNSLLQDQISDYGGVQQSSCQIKLLDQSNQYYLLPLWIVTYKNNKEQQPYYFAMNGATGKISGTLPVDKIKLATTASAIGGLIASLTLLGGYLLF